MKLMEKETSFHIFSTICICEMSHYPWLLLLLLNSRNCLFSKLEKNFHAKKITNNFGFESFRNWSIWKALIVRSLVKLYQFLLRKSFLRKFCLSYESLTRSNHNNRKERIQKYSYLLFPSIAIYQNWNDILHREILLSKISEYLLPPPWVI